MHRPRLPIFPRWCMACLGLLVAACIPSARADSTATEPSSEVTEPTTDEAPARPAPASTHVEAPGTPFAAEAVKAAYLLKFIQFTTWPEEAREEKAPFVIGVAGNRALENQLISMTEGQLIRQRRLHIARIRTPAALASCHLVFFASDTAPPQSEAGVTLSDGLAAVAGRPILTVSDTADFLQQGGMVNFYRHGDKLRFRIAPDAVRAARLILNPSLLALPGVVAPTRSQ